VKISVMSYCFGGEVGKSIAPVEFVKICSELGVDGVEFAVRHVPGGAAEAKEVRKACDDAGLVVACCNASADFATPGDEAAQKRRDEVASIIEFGEAIGARTMMLGTAVPAGMTPEELRRSAAAGIRECLDLMERASFTFNMENRGGSQALVTGRSEHIKEMVEAVGSPKFRVTLDTGNFVAAGEDPVSALDVLASYVIHVHWKDMKFIGASEAERADPVKYSAGVIGEGDTDLAAVAKRLAEMGYDGFVSLEVTGCQEDRERLVRSIEVTRNQFGG